MLSILIPNIRSVQNVASIFRTSACFGVSEIILAGITPGPVDRFGRKRNDFAKIALGTEDTVSWDRIDDAATYMQDFKKKGGKVVMLEQSKQATNLFSFVPEGEVLLVVGEEVSGIPTDLLQAGDYILEIPHTGNKESLNVSIATGIAIAHITRFCN